MKYQVRAIAVSLAWVLDGFLKRLGSVERMEMEGSPRIASHKQSGVKGRCAVEFHEKENNKNKNGASDVFGLVDLGIGTLPKQKGKANWRHWATGERKKDETLNVGVDQKVRANDHWLETH